MKDTLLSNLHWIIIAYALFSLSTVFEEKEAFKEQVIVTMQGVEDRKKQTTKKLAEINKFKANLQASKERVNEVVNQIEKVQKQLPTEVNDTEVQQLLGGFSTELRIKDPKALPSKETLNGFYYEKEYLYEAKGTFLQFLVFFEKLAKADRILNVKKLEIMHDQSGQKGRFQVLTLQAVIESYRYNKGYEEKSGIKEIEAKFK